MKKAIPSLLLTGYFLTALAAVGVLAWDWQNGANEFEAIPGSPPSSFATGDGGRVTASPGFICSVSCRAASGPGCFLQ